MSEQLKEAEPRAPWHRAREGEGGSSSILGRARHISCDFQEHRARSHQPRISPESCSWIFKPQTRPNSSPIKVNKSLPLTRAVAGPGPHWCLLEARYKVWLLFYCYTSDPHSLHYFQACKQAGNSAHTDCICILDWHGESSRRVWMWIAQSSSAQNLQDAAKQSGSIKKLKWNSLEKGIIKCLTSITVLYLF